MYVLLKNIHIGAVVLTAASFLVRGVWMSWRSPLLEHRAVRILPHVIDTVLLASAIALMFLLRQYPFVHAWLTAKVLGLVAYVVFGTIALKRGRSLAVRKTFFVLSIAVFAYIISVALLHNPLGFLIFLSAPRG